MSEDFNISINNIDITPDNLNIDDPTVVTQNVYIDDEFTIDKFIDNGIAAIGTVTSLQFANVAAAQAFLESLSGPIAARITIAGMAGTITAVCSGTEGAYGLALVSSGAGFVTDSALALATAPETLSLAGGLFLGYVAIQEGTQWFNHIATMTQYANAVQDANNDKKQMVVDADTSDPHEIINFLNMAGFAGSLSSDVQLIVRAANGTEYEVIRGQNLDNIKGTSKN